MEVKFRGFIDSDGDILEGILAENGQFDYPEVEDKKSMKRVSQCDGAVFVVAEIEGVIGGFAKGFYDGSRAQIQLVSVANRFKKKGVGSKLVDAVIGRLKAKGAPTVSVVNLESTAEYWSKHGFEKLSVHVMVRRT
ncbi:GNAT family N-acetyltransferase [Vibrio nigripulchritudo]|uniref:GNAT family N-acetyltransferase n=1 Tax=Vibrio nigripulchritudo TaxID=28173 RepID=UPI00056F2B5C|nr:GNAT family N-acetyltransferase [Vibrio nigripulchritudo]